MAQPADPEQNPAENSSLAASAPLFERPISWRQLVPNIVGDQKRIWLFPLRLGHIRNLVAASVVLGVTTGLVTPDPMDGDHFRRSASFHWFNRVFTSNLNAVGTLVAPVSLYAAGLIRRDSKRKGTALVAGEAVADTEIVTLVGFSRVTLSTHFVSNVFMGGVLGYSISRFTVLRR